MYNWDENCDKSFDNSKTTLIFPSIFIALNGGELCRRPVVVSQIAIGGTLTRLEENGNDRVIAFFKTSCYLLRARAQLMIENPLALVWFF